MKTILLSMICSFVFSACITQKNPLSIKEDPYELPTYLEVLAIEIGDQSGNQQFMEVLIRNNGNTSAAPSYILAEFSYGADFFRFSQEIPSIEAQGVQTIIVSVPFGQRLHYYISPNSKQVSIQITLDLFEHIEESDEDNNRLTQWFSYDFFY